MVFLCWSCLPSSAFCQLDVICFSYSITFCAIVSEWASIPLYSDPNYLPVHSSLHQFSTDTFPYLRRQNWALWEKLGAFFNIEVKRPMCKYKQHDLTIKATSILNSSTVNRGNFLRLSTRFGHNPAKFRPAGQWCILCGWLKLTSARG
jgi:hypothetical protein